MKGEMGLKLYLVEFKSVERTVEELVMSSGIPYLREKVRYAMRIHDFYVINIRCPISQKIIAKVINRRGKWNKHPKN